MRTRCGALPREASGSGSLDAYAQRTVPPSRWQNARQVHTGVRVNVHVYCKALAETNAASRSPHGVGRGANGRGRGRGLDKEDLAASCT